MKRIFAVALCLIMLCCTFVSAADFSTYTAISTKAELNAVRNNLNGHYYLTNDIIFTAEDFMSGGAFYNEGSGWLPIGEGSSNSFTGIFDGNGYTISGLKININSTGTVCAGLFGYSKGNIVNLAVENAQINVVGARYAYIGAVCGNSAKGTVSKCYASGSVNFSEGTVSASAGGILGGAYGGTISECASDVDVNISGSAVNAGGIVGTATVDVSKCENYGSVMSSGRSDATAGGICGNGKGVTECFNIGYVYAYSKCDGMVGGIVGKTATAVSDCYNAGICDVSANTYEFCGGVAGKTTATVTDCYYAEGVAEVAVGEGTAKATEIPMASLSSAKSYSGLDLVNTWELDGQILRLKGYETAYGKDIKMVLFYDNSNKIHAYRFGVVGETFDEKILPELPFRTGYITNGWSNEINIPIQEGLIITPVYEKNPDFSYGITAPNCSVTYPAGVVSPSFEDRVTVEASSSGFSHWSCGGTVISDSAKYTFLVMGDMELTPVYGEKVTTPDVFLHSSPVITEDGSGYFKFSMVGSSFVPEGYTFKEAGVLLAAGKYDSSAADDFVIDSTVINTVKIPVKAAYKNSQFMITVKNVFKGNFRSGRAYLIVEDAQGNDVVCYSNQISVAS